MREIVGPRYLGKADICFCIIITAIGLFLDIFTLVGLICFLLLGYHCCYWVILPICGVIVAVIGLLFLLLGYWSYFLVIIIAIGIVLRLLGYYRCYWVILPFLELRLYLHTYVYIGEKLECGN